MANYICKKQSEELFSNEYSDYCHGFAEEEGGYCKECIKRGYHKI